MWGRAAGGFTQVCHSSSFHGRVLTVLLWVHCKGTGSDERAADRGIIQSGLISLCSAGPVCSSRVHTGAQGPVCPISLHSQLHTKQDLSRDNPALPHLSNTQRGLRANPNQGKPKWRDSQNHLVSRMQKEFFFPELLLPTPALP